MPNAIITALVAVWVYTKCLTTCRRLCPFYLSTELCGGNFTLDYSRFQNDRNRLWSFPISTFSRKKTGFDDAKSRPVNDAVGLWGVLVIRAEIVVVEPIDGDWAQCFDVHWLLVVWKRRKHVVVLTGTIGGTRYIRQRLKARH
jgi:hypothetical protein